MTENAKIAHTPGPWRVAGVDVVGDADHWHINAPALLDGFHSEIDCRLATVYSIEANARLVAAAPLLLDALRNLLVRCSAELADPVDVHEVHAARVAVAKATQG